MRERLPYTIFNLILFGAGIPQGCIAGEAVRKRGNVRRRTRYIPKIVDRQKGDPISNISFLTIDAEDLAFRGGISFSMPDVPTTAPAEPPAQPPSREDRALLIENKCQITAIERSRDILTELLTVSDSSSLTNPETSQFKAREWLDHKDPAIICSQNKERIDQRYRLALLYFELGGSSWTRCKAEQDLTESNDEADCPGKRFLDKDNECEWYGLNCGDSYNDVTAEWLDAYYPLEVLNLQFNNLEGELFDEFYDFRGLKEIFLNNNNLSGTISEDIGNLKKVSVLQLESNLFDGPVPEAGLFDLERLAGLSIQDNAVQGSLESLCDARDERRTEYESYLATVEADCLGQPPEVICSCCTCF